MILIAYSEATCKLIHRYVKLDEKDSVKYFECSKCGTRKAEGPKNNIREKWVMGKIKRILKRAESK